MLKNERYDKILELLEKNTYMSAHALAKNLFVSLPTIRRDLAELEKRSQIMRSHGGAKIYSQPHFLSPLEFRKNLNYDKKKLLCRAAAKLISDNDVVYIDQSTTTLQMADFIIDKKDLIVITPAIPLAFSLSQHSNIKLYCTGGSIYKNSASCYGNYAKKFIEDFNIDIMFFSIHGISEKGFLTDPSISESEIRKAAIKNSKKKVLLIDDSKIYHPSIYNIIPITDMDYVVTNSKKIYDLFDKKDWDKIILV